MRYSFIQVAEANSKTIDADLGDILNLVWEIVRISSQIIDNCLKVQSILSNKKLLHMLLMSRNLLSDCCCCLDCLERGHERTIYNNLRMILEDLCAIINASENEKVYIDLLDGKHQASQSVSFATKRYPTHELGYTYGWLSKISHHMEPGLIIRQWINQNGLIAHIKPYDFNRRQAKLDALLAIIQFSCLTGEIVEELCLDELETLYFWTKDKKRKPCSAISLLVTDVTEKIDRMK